MLPSHITKDPLIKAAQVCISEAKFYPSQPLSHKIATEKSFIKQYKQSLKDAMDDKKDAETIAFWKKRLEDSMKKLAQLQKNESVNEATTPHTPTDLYKKASKAGFRTGLIADKLFQYVYNTQGDEEIARRAADAFLSGCARMELNKRQLEGIAKLFEA